jgi:hypothetical protein
MQILWKLRVAQKKKNELFAAEEEGAGRRQSAGD